MRPQGRSHLEVKVLYGRLGQLASRTVAAARLRFASEPQMLARLNTRRVAAAWRRLQPDAEAIGVSLYDARCAQAKMTLLATAAPLEAVRGSGWKLERQTQSVTLAQ